MPQAHHRQLPHRKAHRLPRYSSDHPGLTQLFHEKSELLMMATNRIRIDLNGNNNNIVSLALCVLSEICTAELARDLHQDVLKVLVSPPSASAATRPTSARKPSSQQSKSSRECPSTSLSSCPRYPPASRRRATEYCSAAPPSWKTPSVSTRPTSPRSSSCSLKYSGRTGKSPSSCRASTRSEACKTLSFRSPSSSS